MKFAQETRVDGDYLPPKSQLDQIRRAESGPNTPKWRTGAKRAVALRCPLYRVIRPPIPSFHRSFNFVGPAVCKVQNYRSYPSGSPNYRKRGPSPSYLCKFQNFSSKTQARGRFTKLPKNYILKNGEFRLGDAIFSLARSNYPESTYNVSMSNLTPKWSISTSYGRAYGINGFLRSNTIR